jgi:hypothetical protein
MTGSGDVKLIVWTPAPAMLKLMMSAPAVPFASLIAFRSVPGALWSPCS